MLSINNLTNVFTPGYSKYSKLIQPQQKSNLSFNGNTNLAPLLKDTVSFCGINKDLSNDEIDNYDVCRQININAAQIQEVMEGMLSKHFNLLIYDRNRNIEGVINPIEVRVKTPESIHEKTLAKIKKAWKPDDRGNSRSNEAFSPYDKYAIMDKIRDISASRITIRDIDAKSDEIIDRLCQMIKQENLILDEIENHRFSRSKVYFSNAQLDRLLQCANKQRKQNGLYPLKRVEDSPTETGYMALHLSFDLRNKKIFGDDNGLNTRSFHEMQIIGSDVGKLKDIEDFCYKLATENPKSIMQGDSAYDPFIEYFYKYYPKKDNKTKKAASTRKAFRQYTQKAYEVQRNRKPTDDAENDVTNWAYKYPTVEECGLVGEVPEELDFNILARLKRDLDDVYKVTRHGIEILYGNEPDIDNAGKITYKDPSK